MPSSPSAEPGVMLRKAGVDTAHARRSSREPHGAKPAAKAAVSIAAGQVHHTGVMERAASGSVVEATSVTQRNGSPSTFVELVHLPAAMQPTHSSSYIDVNVVTANSSSCCDSLTNRIQARSTSSPFTSLEPSSPGTRAPGSGGGDGAPSTVAKKEVAHLGAPLSVGRASRVSPNAKPNSFASPPLPGSFMPCDGLGERVPSTAFISVMRNSRLSVSTDQECRSSTAPCVEETRSRPAPAAAKEAANGLESLRKVGAADPPEAHRLPQHVGSANGVGAIAGPPSALGLPSHPPVSESSLPLSVSHPQGNAPTAAPSAAVHLQFCPLYCPPTGGTHTPLIPMPSAGAVRAPDGRLERLKEEQPSSAGSRRGASPCQVFPKRPAAKNGSEVAPCDPSPNGGPITPRERSIGTENETGSSKVGKRTIPSPPPQRVPAGAASAVVSPLQSTTIPHCTCHLVARHAPLGSGSLNEDAPTPIRNSHSRAADSASLNASLSGRSMKIHGPRCLVTQVGESEGRRASRGAPFGRLGSTSRGSTSTASLFSDDPPLDQFFDTSSYPSACASLTPGANLFPAESVTGANPKQPCSGYCEPHEHGDVRGGGRAAKDSIEPALCAATEPPVATAGSHRKPLSVGHTPERRAPGALAKANENVELGAVANCTKGTTAAPGASPDELRKAAHPIGENGCDFPEFLSFGYTCLSD